MRANQTPKSPGFVHQRRGLTLDTICLLDFLGFLDSFLVAVVPDRNVGPGFRQSVCHCQTNSCPSSGNDSSPTCEPEERKNAGRGFRCYGVVVSEDASILVVVDTHFGRSIVESAVSVG